MQILWAIFYLCGMKREVIKTSDGSKTIRILELDENYHSIHGALQEANHVFIKYGLEGLGTKKTLSIFEMGFGTGLNAFLTALKARDLQVKVEYQAIEAYPVSREELQELGYAFLNGKDDIPIYQQLHEVKWEELHGINAHFSLKKINKKLEEAKMEPAYFDLIYYDAFGPRAQEEMWSVGPLRKMYECLKPGGFLVTYCAKGQVKRNLKEVGFRIEVLPGPPGKREMTRAWKD
jgi:tRNA U34 5-methylaminomethyl-2-thiouridine-forming methyltransferase MnmC